MARTVWTPERVREVMEWKKMNQANNTKAAEHFKVSVSSIAQALTKFKKKTKGYYAPKKRSTPQPITLEIPETSMQVAVILMPMRNVKSFIGELWQ